MQKITNWEDLPLMLGTRDLQVVLGVGNAKVREWLRDGRIPSVRVGRAYKIPRDSLRATIEQMAAEG